MKETLMTLKTTQAEAEDSVSFSIHRGIDAVIQDNENPDELILIIGIRSEKFGVKETKTFEIPLNVFSEAIARYRSESDNFLDNPKDYGVETGIARMLANQFFEATAQLPNN
jgi:hypothetical protein